jgi:hypothetical protein
MTQRSSVSAVCALVAGLLAVQPCWATTPSVRAEVAAPVKRHPGRALQAAGIALVAAATLQGAAYPRIARAVPPLRAAAAGSAGAEIFGGLALFLKGLQRSMLGPRGTSRTSR